MEPIPTVEGNVEDVCEYYGEPSDRFTRVMYDALPKLEPLQELAFVCNTMCIQDTDFDDLLKDEALAMMCKRAVELVIVQDPIYEGHVMTAQDLLCGRLGSKAKRPFYLPALGYIVDI
jgi:hypothetical protein